MGIISELDTVSLGDIRRFLRRHYNASSINVAVVGAFDEHQVSEWFDGLLEHLRRGDEAEPSYEVAKIEDRSPIVVRHDGTPHLVVGVLLPPAGSWMYEAARLGAALLGGQGGLLNKHVVRRGAALGVVFKIMPRFMGPSIGLIEFNIPLGRPPQAALEAYHQLVDSYRGVAQSRAAFLAACNRVEGDRLRRDASLSNLCSSLSMSAMGSGSVEQFEGVRDSGTLRRRLESVDIASLWMTIDSLPVVFT